MMNSRGHGLQAQRFAERRKREDDAPRLATEVPGLVDLRLDLEDCSGVVEGNRYIRRVVVDRAPALFLVKCSEPRCTSEEHDLTTPIMRALRSGAKTFSGEDACRGSVGDAECSRLLRFAGVASYRVWPPTASD